MTLVMVVTRPMEGKTNRNAIIVPVTTSPETRGVGESNRLAENDASCEMSEPDRTKEQVDGASTFIPPTRSDFKVLSGIVEKILTSEQKSNSTLKKKKVGRAFRSTSHAHQDFSKGTASITTSSVERYA